MKIPEGKIYLQVHLKIGLIIKLVTEVGLMYQVGHWTQNGIKMVTEVVINIKKVPWNMSSSTKNIIYKILHIIFKCYQNQVKCYDF